jgi:hypothetical protein
MSIKSKIQDGTGFGHITAVTKDNELSTISAVYPPLSLQKTRPFRQYFTTDGTATGSSDMGIDGSTTAVDFYIPADSDDDRYITSINFIVGYGTVGQPNEWADGSALTNGTRLFYTSKKGENDIHDGIKTNQDMFRLSFAPIPTAWEVRHVNATNDYGYFIHTDFRQLGFPFGIKLDRGSSQKIVLKVRDNAGTDADSFNCIAYGFDRFE